MTALAGLLLIGVLHLDHGLARHMAVHVFLMGVVAPLVAMQLPVSTGFFQRGGILGILTALQILLLYFWHSPEALAWSMQSTLRVTFVQLCLLLIAIAFWVGVFNHFRHARWQSIFTILVTGKTFCLLGALLTFSPRPVYPLQLVPLEDQQLAGLIMLTACPITYLLAAFVLTLAGLGFIGTSHEVACQARFAIVGRAGKYQ
jgi:putative membrane protein